MFFISFLLFIFIIFVYLFFKPYNYEKKYQIDEYNIYESYNKSNKNYEFLIRYNDITMPYMINSKYIHKRKLINDIKLFKNENEFCILPSSNYIDFYPLCTDKLEIYTYNLSEVTGVTYKYKEVFYNNKKYNNVNNYYLNNNSYLFYNYKGFTIINNKIEDNIILFSNDVYKLDLVYQKDNYLIVPDYNNSYYFNKFFVINILTGKVKEIKNNYEIYFDGFFLGSHKSNVYYVDKKEQKEYKINLQKKSIELIDYTNINNNRLVKCNYEDLKVVEKQSVYNYIIENNNLYLNINNNKIKISNKEVSKVIKIVDDTVYYLSNDTLYMYNNLYGEVKLISNFEWNFNTTNMIFFYK